MFEAKRYFSLIDIWKFVAESPRWFKEVASINIAYVSGSTLKSYFHQNKIKGLPIDSDILIY